MSLLAKVGLVLLYPAIVAHELTHYVATVSAAYETQLVFDGAQAAVLASWAAGTPRWRVALAHLAPALVGLLVAPFVVVFALSLAPVLSLWLLVSWLVYSWPSKTDRQLPV